jgi:peptidyl-tRNA hydrolase
LYVITRSDLSLGYQAVQSMHALREFVQEHPETDREWYSKSNYLALLSVKNEHDLVVLLHKAASTGLRVSVFREPDVGNEITAIALEPGPKSKRLCSSLPLAFNTS